MFLKLSMLLQLSMLQKPALIFDAAVAVVNVAAVTVVSVAAVSVIKVAELTDYLP